MSERAGAPPPEARGQTPPPSEAPRDQWTREDDELLLLDELEEVDEAPDDDLVDEVV
jgi:hypothetical protein